MDNWIRVLSPQDRLRMMIEVMDETDVLEACLLRATTAMETIDAKLRELGEQPSNERRERES